MLSATSNCASITFPWYHTGNTPEILHMGHQLESNSKPDTPIIITITSHLAITSSLHHTRPLHRHCITFRPLHTCDHHHHIIFSICSTPVWPFFSRVQSRTPNSHTTHTSTHVHTNTHIQTDMYIYIKQSYMHKSGLLTLKSIPSFLKNASRGPRTVECKSTQGEEAWGGEGGGWGVCRQKVWGDHY